jgi:hypothetical protein
MLAETIDPRGGLVLPTLDDDWLGQMILESNDAPLIFHIKMANNSCQIET